MSRKDQVMGKLADRPIASFNLLLLPSLDNLLAARSPYNTDRPILLVISMIILLPYSCFVPRPCTGA